MMGRRLPRIGWGLAWSSATEVVARTLALAYVMVLARHLAPAEFGTFNVLLTYFALAVALGNGGIDRIATRDLASGRIPFDSLGTILTLRIAAGALSSGALILVGFLLYPEALAFYCILAAAALPAAVSSVLVSAYHAEERFDVPGASLVCAAGVMMLLVAIGAAARLPLSFFVVAFLASELARAAWLLGFARGRPWQVRPAFEGSLASYTLRAALPLGAVTILGLVYLRVDLLMLEHLSGARAVAQYAAAYRVMDALVLIPAVSLGVIFPRVARWQRGNAPEAARMYLASTQAMLVLGILIAAAGLIFAGPIVRLLFSSTYADAAPVLSFLMVALVFVFWHAPNGTFLFADHRLRTVVGLSALFVAINVGLNLLLIPRFAAVGAAAATAVSGALAVLAFTPIVCRRLRISPTEYFRALRAPWRVIVDVRGLRGEPLRTTPRVMRGDGTQQTASL